MSFWTVGYDAMRSIRKGPHFRRTGRKAFLVSVMSCWEFSLVKGSASFCSEGIHESFILHWYCISSQKICLQMSVRNCCFEEPPDV